MMQDQWLDDIRRHEGFRAHAYWDLTGRAVHPSRLRGHLTIGYGFLIDTDGGIPRPVAEYWLRWIVSQIEGELDSRMPWWRSLPAQAQRAIVNMAYNLGVPKLLSFRRMLAALQEGDYEKAAAEALDSRWARQVGRRAQAVAEWIRAAGVQ